MKNTIFTSALLGLFVTVCDSYAQDWPQWRGPGRDGVVSSFTAPATWPQELKLQWKVDVGIGYSSPVVVEGKVYVLSRQGEREIISCVELASGRLRWQEGYPAPYTVNSAARSHGKAPKATPVVNDGKLFTLGISGILSSLDAETGALRWRKEFDDQFSETSPLYGAAMSAVVDNGTLIVHVGGHGEGALRAFDADTGEVKWSWEGDGPGYTSPIIVELGGTRQLVTQTQESMAGFAVDTGKLLWSIPFSTSYTQNIVTPVVYEGTLIFSGLGKGIMAIKPTRRGDEWTTPKVWENSDLSMYMSSPVVVGDLLFGLSQYKSGQFFCLDPRTGNLHWVSDGRQGENAAILSAGEVLFLLTEGADLIVAKASGKGFEEIQTYSVANSPTYAHPVVLGSRMLIKDESTLALWALE